ncbi:hypothetical protein Taro_033178, partial [Colocasia esculenta]|nr:hypothetical protein [Colocasia esculenta]
MGACGGPLTLARLSLPPRPVFSGVGLPHCNAGSEQGGNKAVAASSKASSVSAIEQLKTSTDDHLFFPANKKGDYLLLGGNRKRRAHILTLFSSWFEINAAK